MFTVSAIQGNFNAPFSRGSLVLEEVGGFRSDCGRLGADELVALVASGEAAMLPWMVEVKEGAVGWIVGAKMGEARDALLSALGLKGALLHRLDLGDRWVLLVDPVRAEGVRESLSHSAAWRSMIASSLRSYDEALRWSEVAYAVATTVTPDLVALLSEAMRAVGRDEDAAALVRMEVNSKVL